jgi:FOG: PKD repeat
MLKQSVNPELAWEKTLLLLLVCLCITTSLAFADYHITRGPDIGEIYFVGPTITGEGIYHSTDFGKTAVCMDSITPVISICADKTPGVLYYDYFDNLFISYNYGQYGSWIFRTSEGSYVINSGRNEGEIFPGPWISSNDYGINFTQHALNGCFCNVAHTFEIGSQDSIGYYVGGIWGINDTLWLLISYDNFDSLEIQNVYNVNENPIRDLSRGTENGELYNFADAPKKLKYSYDYGETWELHNVLNYGLDYKDMVGGRQEGGVYVYGYYGANMLTIEHSYIFHSTDYGKNFEVYHPFSKGEEPLVANFSSATTEGNAPLTISFCNYSVGDIQSYEWDFNNDGVIDSYDQEPEYTYQDTGYYSVKLTVYDTDGSDEFLRENYIHVKDPNAVDEEAHFAMILNNTPNPFRSSTIISYTLPSNIREAEIEIYNIKGQLVKTLIPFPNRGLGTSEVVWDGKDDRGKQVGAGMYFLYMKTGKNVNIKK